VTGLRLGPPGFWQADGATARLLSPAAAVVAAITARRVAREGWRAPVAVICCGNAGVGGAGKTTVALDLLRRLAARGVAVHALTRGHGGRARGVLRVGPDTPASVAGDEALLLAACAPTWVSSDRAAGARAAVEAGAGCLVMDDGLQNPGLAQDCGLLVIDGAVGFGNGRVLPAGPLREPVAAAAGRCRAAVLIGEDRRGVLASLPPALPVLRARLVPQGGGHLAGRRVFGFAGIARPSKFYDTLAATGATLAGTMDFPDHHRFRDGELRRLLASAARLDAVPVTTPKDAVRLPDAVRAVVEVLGVALAWEDEAAWEALLDAVFEAGKVEALPQTPPKARLWNPLV
jgi:tetraacyldisaccharide 4'-kinase